MEARVEVRHDREPKTAGRELPECRWDVREHAPRVGSGEVLEHGGEHRLERERGLDHPRIREGCGHEAPPPRAFSSVTISGPWREGERGCAGVRGAKAAFESEWIDRHSLSPSKPSVGLSDGLDGLEQRTRRVEEYRADHGLISAGPDHWSSGDCQNWINTPNADRG